VPENVPKNAHVACRQTRNDWVARYVSLLTVMRRPILLAILGCLAILVQISFAGALPTCSPSATSALAMKCVHTGRTGCLCCGHPMEGCNSSEVNLRSKEVRAGACSCSVDYHNAPAVLRLTASVSSVSIIERKREAVRLSPLLDDVHEPGTVGSDSGPPLPALHDPDLGRAPPVA
jgi:hypothetical protein